MPADLPRLGQHPAAGKPIVRFKLRVCWCWYKLECCPWWHCQDNVQEQPVPGHDTHLPAGWGTDGGARAKGGRARISMITMCPPQCGQQPQGSGVVSTSAVSGDIG